MKLDGHRMDTYVQRSPIKSDIPDYTDWYWGFVRDYLSGNTVKGTDYYLDIAKLENIASINHHIPDNDTFRDQVKGLTPDQVRIYADHVFDHYPENLWAAKTRMFLQNLDRDFTTTMSDLNNALAAYVCRHTDEQYEDFHWPKFRVVNAERYEVEINSITPDHKDQLVQLTGTLLYISDPPEMEYIQRAYLCHACNDTFTTVDRTAECSLCGKGPVEFLQDDPETLARNFQEGILQENVEDLTRSVASINIRFYDELINQLAPGDRVKLVGKVTVKQIPKKKSYFYWIDVFSCKNMDEELVNITQKDIEEIEEFRKTHALPLDDLADMFVPGIVGYQEVKKAMILQAVSGMERRYPDKIERGRIHILLAGDPGKAKSQFLLANKHIESKSFYLSDTSKAGLTVAVSNVGQKRVLVPGIMVLANGGTACIGRAANISRKGIIEISHRGLKITVKVLEEQPHFCGPYILMVMVKNVVCVNPDLIWSKPLDLISESVIAWNKVIYGGDSLNFCYVQVIIIVIAPSLVHPFKRVVRKVITYKSPVPICVIWDIRLDWGPLDVCIHAMSVQLHSTAPKLKEGKSRTYETGPIQRTIASQFLLSWKDFSIALGILVVGDSGVSIIYNPSWTAWLQGTSRP